MIDPAEVSRLWERDSVDLRLLMAHIAGVLVERHGREEAANVMRRIVGDPVKPVGDVH